MMLLARTDVVSLSLGAGYLAIGFVTAWLLSRRGHGPTVALGALACWPLLLPLLRRPPPRSVGRGPLVARIDAAVDSLRDAMGDPAAVDLDLPADLDRLVAELERADERLAMVDRLVRQIGAHGPATPAVAEGLAQLQRARETTTAEIEAVLDGMVQLRLQIGLRSLAGNSVPIRERLRDLRARLAAIDELAAMELHA